MDARLFFEVLLYLNCYYFGLFFVTETIMVLAKYFSAKFPTPNIDLDGGILCIIMLSEFTKLFMFRRMKETKPGLSNFLAISLTMISILGLLYVLIIQHPVLKMEYIVCGVMFVLMVTITVYGFLQFVPCCQKKLYV
ncbi:hypothetical protein Trydic_g9802 [Trypoxylus dichotomus]